MNRFSLTVLGTRGSVTVSGKEYERFGGMTSCYLVRAGDQVLFLDAGTGIIHAPEMEESEPAILISHLHLDHLVGLGMYPRLSKKGRCTKIYLPAKDDDNALAELDSFLPPLSNVAKLVFSYYYVYQLKPQPLFISQLEKDLNVPTLYLKHEEAW